MTIIFGSPEALEILKRDTGLRAEAERIAVLEAGPAATLTPEERAKYVDIVADFILVDYEGQAREDAEAMTDRALLAYLMNNVRTYYRDAKAILESRFA